MLDLVIALEALLSDDKQEMTHKVALRAAALYKLIDRTKPLAVLKEIKEIYGQRSKIAHGASVDEKMTVRTRDVTIEEAAVEHLRAVLGIVIERPEFLDPHVIDQKLLLTNDGLTNGIQDEVA